MLVAHDPLGSTAEAHAFFATDLPVASVTGDREELYGLGGSRSRPSALERKNLSGRTGVGLDPCGALQIPLEVPAGEARELCFVLGYAGNRATAHELAARYMAPGAVERIRRAGSGLGRPARSRLRHRMKLSTSW